MKKWLLFRLVVVVAVGASAQDISGNWVSATTRTSTLKNRTVDRAYEITINKKMKSLEGKIKSFFSWKSTYMGFNLFGKVDMARQVLTLHTENLSSSVTGDRANMKDGNQYKWNYTFDSTKEYLTLVLNETDPHIILDSNIVFSRPRTNNAYVAVQPVPVGVKQEDSLTTTATITQTVTERTNKLFKEIIADADSVKIDLYDVGEIDGDSVALFLNGKLIAEHQLLKASATTFRIVLDRSLPENRLVLFAENLGKVPPNTAYMVITINKKEYTLNMQSDEKTNGEIVFRFVVK